MSENTDPPPPPPDPPKEPRTFTQAELDAIIQREKATLKAKLDAVATKAAEYDALAPKLAALEEEKRKAEEAKLSAAERADKERAREREAATKAQTEALATIERERSLRHGLMRSGKASELVGSLATKLHTPALLPVVRDIVAARLVVRSSDDGREQLMLRMSDASDDLEPVETGFAKVVEAELSPAFFKAVGGSGAQGGSGVGGKQGWQMLTPTERIEAGLK